MMVMVMAMASLPAAPLSALSLPWNSHRALRFGAWCSAVQHSAAREHREAAAPVAMPQRCLARLYETEPLAIVQRN